MDDIAVLVADDHPVFRDGLRSLLSSVEGLRVVGEAGTGHEAVDAAAAVQPDVVVMDLHMPELNGVEATRRIVQASPHVGVLVLTMLEDDDSVFSVMRAGARGYVLKGAGQDDVVRAVQAVARGEIILGATIAARVMHYFSTLLPPVAVSAFPELTDREREILGLIAAGLSNDTISHRLGVRPKTVRNHISNIFAKLHVADRAQAIVRARSSGLGGAPT